MNPEELRSSWNKIAREYQRKHDRPIDDVCYGRLSPTERTLGLLGNVNGKRILDLGCGGGQNCVALTRMGAVCTGVDISEEQIHWANVLAEQEGLTIEFHRKELLGFLSSIPDSSYDIVLSVFCFPYLQDLPSHFRHIHRILSSTGILVFATNHPFRDVAETDSGKVVVRKSYFESGPEQWDFKGVNQEALAPLVTYRRTFGDLLNPLSDAGFIIERLVEPEPVSEDEFFQDEAELYSRVPAALICKARAGKSL
jgi:2-polyprenyl-3-methyl-5-hydroxy-6-metoxy-1,4-benzoquinol methylase